MWSCLVSEAQIEGLKGPKPMSFMMICLLAPLMTGAYYDKPNKRNNGQGIGGPPVVAAVR